MEFQSLIIAIVVLIIAIFGAAQSAIALKTYNDANRTKDVSYNFSIFILVLSIMVILGSMTYMFMGLKAPPMQPPSAVAGSTTLGQPVYQQLETSANQAVLDAANKIRASRALQLVKA